MALLLDTQVIIWLEENPEKIPAPVKAIISSEAEIFFSKVSAWEMAIKIQTGKLKTKQELRILISNFQTDYKISLLDISLTHIYKTQSLELFHRDPFDRLLIAQSLVENIPIISSDLIFDDYCVNRIW